jgi:DNA polymerase-3 subunit alpha
LRFPYDEFYLKTAEEMAIMFSSVPSCIFNTVEFANRIDSNDILKNIFRSNMRLPNFDIPKEFKTEKDDFENRFNYLKSLVKEGLKRRGWDKSKKHIDRVKMELEDLRVAWENNEYDFPTYFLISYDLMKKANDKDIFTGDGRGSCYASVILHCLGVCYGLDPIDDKYGLIWERFLAFKSDRNVSSSDFGFGKKDVIEIRETEDEEDIGDEEEF